MSSSLTRPTLLVLLAGAGLSLATPVHAAGSSAWRTSEVTRNDTYGTVRHMSGSWKTSGRTPEAAAREFLRAERNTIGIAQPDRDLKVTRVSGPDEVGMTHVWFAHQSKGIPVFGSDLVVHLRGSTVESLNGAFIRSFELAPRVVVGGDDAADLAIDLVQDLVNLDHIDALKGGRELGLDLSSDPSLVWYNHGLVNDGRTETRLAWQLSINQYNVIVDAQNGKILDHWDTLHDAMKREVYDTNHSTNLPGKLVCSESTGCNSTDTDTKNAWSQFADTYNYFKNTHSRDSWDNKGGVMKGTVHYSTNYQNAYWNGSQMVFGDGFVGLDVTAHELGHAVCQSTANLTYKSQSGALNESFSDVWGAMVDREDWEIGEDIPIGVIRDMSDPNAYGQPKDMDEYKNYLFYDNGGVHINSGIPNYACYLLSDGGSNNGITVKGMGRSVTEKIWYRTESTKLTSSSKFADFAKAAVTACGELYGGTSSPTCKETEAAMKAVGIL